jgi:hypothetical protein
MERAMTDDTRPMLEPPLDGTVVRFVERGRLRCRLVLELRAAPRDFGPGRTRAREVVVKAPLASLLTK